MYFSNYSFVQLSSVYFRQRDGGGFLSVLRDRSLSYVKKKVGQKKNRKP